MKKKILKEIWLRELEIREKVEAIQTTRLLTSTSILL